MHLLSSQLSRSQLSFIRQLAPFGKIDMFARAETPAILASTRLSVPDRICRLMAPTRLAAVASRRPRAAALSEVCGPGVGHPGPLGHPRSQLSAHSLRLYVLKHASSLEDAAEALRHGQNRRREPLRCGAIWQIHERSFWMPSIQQHWAAVCSCQDCRFVARNFQDMRRHLPGVAVVASSNLMMASATMLRRPLGV